MQTQYSQVTRSLRAATAFFAVFTLASGALFEAVASQLKAYDLSVNQLEEAIGLDTQKLSFSWKLEGKERNITQKAYRIKIFNTLLEGGMGDQLWDSGKVASDQSVSIPYRGPSLKSRGIYKWELSAWTDDDSAPAEAQGSFEMALLEKDDWSATWIGSKSKGSSLDPTPAPLFRKSFTLEKPVTQARVYVSGLGYFVMKLNGQAVSDHVLDPVVTRYDRRSKYLVFDVSAQLQKGENVIALTLGNGWMNQHTDSAWDFTQAPWRDHPKLIAQLEVLHPDGSKTVVNSDESWKWTEGPVVFDGIRNGEHIDARHALPGWDSPGFDDSNWKKAIPAKAPTDKLSAQLMPPARIVEQLDPKKVTRIDDKITVYDFGRNTSGRVQIELKGKPGDEVAVRYGERLFENGRLDQVELSRFIRTGETQTDRFILGPDGHGVFEPYFMYHGFQYVEVEKSVPSLDIKSIKANIIHTDLQSAGGFDSSNPLLNELYKVSRNSFLTNYHSYPTDCPHREKIGWTGDGQMVMDFAFFNFDVALAYKKWLDDMRDEQRPNGQLPSIVPTSGWGYLRGSWRNDADPYKEAGHGPQWEGVGISLAWNLYLNTGDTFLLERYYPMMKEYLTFLDSWSENDTLNIGIDDHKWIRQQTQSPVIASAYYYHLTDIAKNAAAVLEREDDLKHFAKRADAIKKGFNKRFLDTETGRYDIGSQTTQAMAIAFDLAPEDLRPKVIDAFLETIKAQDGHPIAGVVGMRAMIDALPEIGRSDLLYEILNLRSEPSFGWWLDQGATTLWQNWDGSQSRNHIMFGSFNDFFYENLAGIQLDPQAPAYKHFFIKPFVPDELESAEAWHDGPHGKISGAWEKKGNALQLTIEVPANSSATLQIPSELGESIRESGKELRKAKGIRKIVRESEYTEVTIGSGSYRFQIKNR